MSKKEDKTFANTNKNEDEFEDGALGGSDAFGMFDEGDGFSDTEDDASKPAPEFNIKNFDLNQFNKSARKAASAKIKATIGEWFPKSNKTVNSYIETGEQFSKLYRTSIKDIRQQLGDTSRAVKELLKSADDMVASNPSIPGKLKPYVSAAVKPGVKVVNKVADIGEKVGLPPEENETSSLVDEKIPTPEERAAQRENERKQLRENERANALALLEAKEISAAAQSSAAEARNAARQQMQGIVQTQIQGKQFSANYEVLQEIRNHTVFHTDFLRTTFTAYLKQDLTLQFKQLYVAEDLLELTKTHSKAVATILSNIQHNTGLSDSAKATVADTIKDTITQNLLSSGTDYFKNFTDKVIGNVKEKFIKPIQMGLAQAYMGASMLSTFGSGIDLVQMMLPDGISGLAGNVVGKYATNKLTSKLLKNLDGKTVDWIESNVGNIDIVLPMVLEKMAHGDERPGILRNMPDALYYKLSDVARMLIPEMPRGGSRYLTNTNMLADPTAAGTITNRFVTTVEDVIPSYLRLQTKYLEALATGKDVSEVEERAFSFKQGRLVSASTILKEIDADYINHTRAAAIVTATTEALKNESLTKTLSAENKKLLDTHLIDIAQIVQNMARAKDPDLMTFTPEMLPWFKEVAEAGVLTLSAADARAQKWYKTLFRKNVERPKEAANAILTLMLSNPETNRRLNQTISSNIATLLRNDVFSKSLTGLDTNLRRFGYGTLSGTEKYFQHDKFGNRIVDAHGFKLDASQEENQFIFDQNSGIDQQKLRAGRYRDFSIDTGERIVGFDLFKRFHNASTTFSDKILDTVGGGLKDAADLVGVGKVFDNVSDSIDNTIKRGVGIVDDFINDKISDNYALDANAAKVEAWLNSNAAVRAVIPLFIVARNGGVGFRRKWPWKLIYRYITRQPGLLEALFALPQAIANDHNSNEAKWLSYSTPPIIKRLWELGYDRVAKIIKNSGSGAEAILSKLVGGETLDVNRYMDKATRMANFAKRSAKQTVSGHASFANLEREYNKIRSAPKAKGNTTKSQDDNIISKGFDAVKDILSQNTTNQEKPESSQDTDTSVKTENINTSDAKSLWEAAKKYVSEQADNAAKKLDEFVNDADKSDKNDTDQAEESSEDKPASDDQAAKDESILKNVSDKVSGMVNDALKAASETLGGKKKESEQKSDETKEETAKEKADKENASNSYFDRMKSTMEEAMKSVGGMFKHGAAAVESTIGGTASSSLSSLMEREIDLIAEIRDILLEYFANKEVSQPGFFSRLFRRKSSAGKNEDKASSSSRWQHSNNKLFRALGATADFAKAAMWDLPLGAITSTATRVTGFGRALLSNQISEVRLRPAANEELEDTKILITEEQFKAGVFSDKNGKHRLKSVHDIRGVVYDGKGNPLISKDDIKYGLVDGKGRVIRTWDKALGRTIHNTGSYAIGKSFELTKRIGGFLLEQAPFRAAWKLMSAPVSGTVAALIKYRDIYSNVHPPVDSEGNHQDPLVTATALKNNLVCFSDGSRVPDSYSITKPVLWRDVPENGTLAGQVAISTVDINSGLIDSNGKPLRSISRILGSVTRKTVGRAFSVVGSAISGLFKLNKWTLENAWSLTKKAFTSANPYIDVYVDNPEIPQEGERVPRLLGLKIKAGVEDPSHASYFYTDGTIVTSAYGIKGKVVDRDGNIIIDEDELPYVNDVSGKHLSKWRGRSFMGKLASFNFSVVNNAVALAWKTAKNTFKGLGNIGEFLSKKMWKLGGEALGLVYSSMRDILGIVFSKGQMVTRKDLQEIVGEKLEDIYLLIYERLQGVKGDADGDGIRDGSYEEYRKRKEERQRAKEEAAAAAEKKTTKADGKSLFATLAGMFTGKKEEAPKKEEEDGGIMDTISNALELKDLYEWGKETKVGKWLGRKFGTAAKWASKIKDTRVGKWGSSVVNWAKGLRTTGVRAGLSTAARSVAGTVGTRVASTAVGGAIASAAGIGAAGALTIGLGVTVVGAIGFGLYKWLSDSDRVENFRNIRGCWYGIKNPQDYEDELEDLEEIVLDILRGDTKWPLAQDELIDIGIAFNIIDEDKDETKEALTNRAAYVSQWLGERVLPFYRAYVTTMNKYFGNEDIYETPNPDDFESDDEAKTFIMNVEKGLHKRLAECSEFIPTRYGFEAWWRTNHRKDPDFQKKVNEGKLTSASAALITGTGAELLDEAKRKSEEQRLKNEDDKLAITQERIKTAKKVAELKKMNEYLKNAGAYGERAAKARNFESADAMIAANNKEIAKLTEELAKPLSEKTGEEVATATKDTKDGSLKATADQLAVDPASSFYNPFQQDRGHSAGNATTEVSFDPSKLEATSVPDSGVGDLGTYVKKWESNSDGVNAIGFDTRGGTSYGTYQIAARPGTFGEFLEFIDRYGGNFGKTMSSEFRKLSKDEIDSGRDGVGAKLWRKFASVQGGKVLQALERAFISSTHYDKALGSIENPNASTLIRKDRGLREALWSTAVQHGPGGRTSGAAGIFNTTYRDGISAQEWLKAIYKKRSTQFSKATERERRGVMNRYMEELPLVMGLSKASNPEATVSTLPQDNINNKPDGETETSDVSSYANSGNAQGVQTNSATPFAASAERTITSASLTPEQLKQLPTNVQEAIDQLKALGVRAYNTTGGGGYKGVAKVNPDLLARFAAAAKEFYNSTGQLVSITSAWRSPADQASLQGTAGAGKVGRSPHQRGAAIDIGDANGGGVKGRGYGTGTIADAFEAVAKKYGLYRPYNPLNKTGRALRNEEQHFELMKSAIDKSSPESQGLDGGIPLDTTKAPSTSDPRTGLREDGTYSAPGIGSNGPTMSSPQPSAGSVSDAAGTADSSTLSKTGDATTISQTVPAVTAAAATTAPATLATASSTGSMSNSSVSSSTGEAAAGGASPVVANAEVQSVPFNEQKPAALESGDELGLAELKLQSRYLAILCEQTKGLVSVTQQLTGGHSSEGTKRVSNTTNTNDSTDLNTVLAQYLGENSPLLQAIMSLKSGLSSSNTTSTTTTSRTGRSKQPTVVSAPIDNRKVYTV